MPDRSTVLVGGMISYSGPKLQSLYCDGGGMHYCGRMNGATDVFLLMCAYLLISVCLHACLLGAYLGR